MARQRITMEWHMGEEEDWNSPAIPLQTPDVPVQITDLNRLLTRVSPEREIALWVVRTLIFFCLALFMVTSATIVPDRQQRLYRQAHVQQIVDLERNAWQNDDFELFDSLVDENVESHWRSEWRGNWFSAAEKSQEFGTTVLEIEQVDDFMLVKMQISRASNEWWRSSPYRETRFYHQTEEGWLRTVPAPEFWGPEHIRETEHLRFEYRTRDADAVEPIIEQMEILYLTLHQMLELDPTDSEEKLVFILSPEGGRRWSSFGKRHIMTSPALSKVPATLSDTEFLAHLIVSRFTYLIVNGLLYESGKPILLNEWESLIWALNGWLRSDLLGQRSPWHEQAEGKFRRYAGSRLPLQLTDISTWTGDVRPEQGRVMQQYMVAESAVAYLVHAYGRERLSLLLEGLQEHRAWSGLIPGLVGDSVEEFEAGWNQFLLDTYTVSDGVNTYLWDD